MITSLSNPKVKLVQNLQARRRVRHRQRLLVAEGTRLVQEALAAGFLPRFVFITSTWGESSEGAALLSELAAPTFLLSDEVMAACADTETPQGILAVLPFPRIAPPTSPTLVLVVDRLRTPGNLGTLMRTAVAAGVEVLLLPPGNVDPFNPKAVRGGMGAHFRLPILSLDWAEIRDYLSGLNIWLASAGKGIQYDQVDWTIPTALIIGGEASGAGEEADSMVETDPSPGALCGRVHIPMPGGMESLNAAVAAGILLFEAVRQRS